ncbi:hypothetical protein ACNOYE_37500 [Nannocystaceae bacterium ST9]
MAEIDLEAWARQLGFDAFDDLEQLDASIFGDLMRVRQVDPSKRWR